MDALEPACRNLIGLVIDDLLEGSRVQLHRCPDWVDACATASPLLLGAWAGLIGEDADGLSGDRASNSNLVLWADGIPTTAKECNWRGVEECSVVTWLRVSNLAVPIGLCNGLTLVAAGADVSISETVWQVTVLYWSALYSEYI